MTGRYRQAQNNLVFHQACHIQGRFRDQGIHQGIFTFPTLQLGLIPRHGQNIAQFKPLRKLFQTTLACQPKPGVDPQPQYGPARLRSARNMVLHCNII